ncbi:MAG: hypothetical protein ABEN55_14495 [Bradymonadaceae bacterium]
MVTRARIFGCLVALASLCVSAAPAAAADWDRFPDLLPGQRVGIKKLYDGPRYYELRSCYRNYDSEVGADYFGALVDVTTKSGKSKAVEADADPYAAALAEAWADDEQLAPKNHVLVVLGLANRSVGIHAGSKWTDLGFEGDLVDRTIQASEFDEHMQINDYASAMCSILDTVDIRLAALENQRTRRIATLREEIPALRKKITALRTNLDKRFPEDHPFGDSVRKPLTEAKAKTKRAKSKFEDHTAAAGELVDEARTGLEQARQRLDAYDEDVARLKEVETALADLKSTIEHRPDADWNGPEAALSKLAECNQLAARFRKSYEGSVADVRTCKRAVEGRLAQADSRYYYLMTVMPVLGTVLLIALLGWLLFVRIRRRERTLEFLEPELEQWERQLDRTRDEIGRLQRAHAGYFGRYDQLWEGDSADLDRAAADATVRMCLFERRGDELLDRAKSHYRDTHRLEVAPLEEALRTLREAGVDFQPGDRDPRHRIGMPLCDPYRGQANALLGDLADAHRRARDQLDAWQQAHRFRHRDPRRAADLFETAAELFEEVGDPAGPSVSWPRSRPAGHSARSPAKLASSSRSSPGSPNGSKRPETTVTATSRWRPPTS